MYNAYLPLAQWNAWPRASASAAALAERVKKRIYGFEFAEDFFCALPDEIRALASPDAALVEALEFAVMAHDAAQEYNGFEDGEGCYDGDGDTPIETARKALADIKGGDSDE